MNDQDQELAELDAQLASLSIDSEDEERARKAQAITDKRALVEAVKRYGKVDKEIAWCMAGDSMVILKRPTQALWRTAKANENQQEREEQVVYGCLVHPSASEFSNLISRYPITVSNCFTLASFLAGFGAENSLAK